MTITRVLTSAGIFLMGFTAMAHGGDEEFNGPTAYEVPIQNAPELIPYAHFEMPATVIFKQDHWEFCYRLPEDLVGPDQKVPQIDFVTTEQLSANTFKVVGPHTDGTCTFGAQASCHLTYGRLNLDIGAIKIFLATKFTGEELKMRSEVATRFAFDPEGILLFTDNSTTTQGASHHDIH